MNHTVVEHCIMYHHGLGNKIEIFPIPLESSICATNSFIDDVVRAMNYLSEQGWRLISTTQLKKTRVMQYLFVREQLCRRRSQEKQNKTTKN